MSTFFFAPEWISERDLTVRSYQPGDGPALSLALNASYDHLHRWMPWAKPHQTDDESEAAVRRFRGNYLLNTDFVLGIWLTGPDGPRLAGGTGFHLTRGGSLDTRAADIGMWIAAPVAGQGLGTRVLRLLLRWGFDAWPWERLTWHCDTHNRASARVAEKAGLQLEGTLRQNWPDVGGHRRDTRLYSMLKAEWAGRMSS